MSKGKRRRNRHTTRKIRRCRTREDEMDFSRANFEYEPPQTPKRTTRSRARDEEHSTFPQMSRGSTYGYGHGKVY